MFDFSRENRSLLASWWRNIDKTILSLILLLFFLGLFFSFSSTSSVIGEKLNKESYFFFLKHFVFVVIALIIILFISLQKRETIKAYLPYFFIIFLLLLFLVPLIGTEVKGAKRWLDIPLLPRFQPIEILKPFFILILAQIISSQVIHNLYRKYFYTLVLLSAVLFLLIIQPDLGQSVLLFSSWLVMVFSSGINFIILVIFFLICVLIFVSILFFFPNKFGYILFRLKSFIDPTKGENYQSEKALEAIKNGGFTGRGLGEGVLKDRVPEAHTDYMFAVIAEEFGAILLLLLLIIFLFFSYKVLHKLLDEKDEYTKLVLVGLISLLLIQTFIHIGVNIRLLPTTGITLPFLSYGGSSIVGNAIMAGLILNLTKKIPLNQDTL
jgi:cell division protein FtsW